MIITIENLIERQRGFDYLNSVQQMRDSMTLDEVNAAFRKYILPEQLVYGAAGDFDAPPPAKPSK